MEQFIKKLFRFSLAGGIPLLLLTAGYWYYDPYKVLRPYSNYSQLYVSTNRDYVSTEMFLKNNPQQQYNAFIFGSSRALSFSPSAWKKYLPQNAHPYTFDASGESVYGIYTKLKYLDSMHTAIQDALLVICRDVTFANSSNHDGHLFIKHPITSGESRLSFQYCFFRSYLSARFIIPFYDYTFSRTYKPYMKGYIENRNIITEPVTNVVFISEREKEIQEDPAGYYTARKDIFYQRNGQRTDAVTRIGPEHFLMLREIKRILEKNHTNYKIIISPLYEQIKLSTPDYTTLQTLFGERLYDFSGSNAFTNSINNYYEPSHFRPNVADSILSILYK